MFAVLSTSAIRSDEKGLNGCYLAPFSSTIDSLMIVNTAQPDGNNGPLTQQRKTRRHSRLKHSQQKSDGNRASEVRHGCVQNQQRAPEDDIEGAVLGQRQSLEQQVCRIFPEQVAVMHQSVERWTKYRVRKGLYPK